MKKHFANILLFVGILALTAGPALAENNAPTKINVGDFKVEILTDSVMDGTPAILTNVTPELIEKYIPTGKFPLPVNTLLVQTSDKNILFDSGLGEKLLAQLKERGLAPEQIDTIFLTHMHFDHIAGLVKDGQALFPKAKIYLAVNEKNFWADNANLTAMPKDAQEQFQDNFKLAQSVLAAYDGRVEEFSPASLEGQLTELMPGISPAAAYGHTPGHTVYILTSQGQKLLIAGDLFHVAVIQFPRPEVTLIFDSDQAQAAQTRAAVFAFVQKNALPLTGMHKADALFGTLEKDSQETSGYTFKPMQ